MPTVAQDEDARDDGKPSADELTAPEFVFAIEASDSMIKQRIMKLPESQVAGTRNSEEGLKNQTAYNHILTNAKFSII